MTAGDDLFLAGVHFAKTAGSTVAEHARSHLGEPAFHYYCRFTRTRRFWAGLPQYEELPEHEKSRIRLIFGHGVRFKVVTLQDRIPEFFTTIRHPVPYFHSRFTHESLHHERRATRLPFEAFVKKEKHNQFSWFLVASFGELAEFGDEISYRNSVSILRNFKYVFATEQIDAQSPALWNALGVASGMERKRVAKEMEHVPLSDEEILAMNPVDLQLYEEIAAVRAGDVDGNGALNPFGYDPERYFDAVASKRNAQRRDRQTQVEAAYGELANQLFLECTLEAALERMCQSAPHVENPGALRNALAHKHERFSPRYNEQQRDRSRRNTEANRKRYRSAAACLSSTGEQDPGVTRADNAVADVQERSRITNYLQVLDCEPEDFDRVELMKPGEVLVYVHLPKAAGNSSIGALRDHFPPYVSVNWRKPREHVEEIVAKWNDDPLQFISGHINHAALEPIEGSGIPHIRITFLRHPVERIISSYRYNTSAKAPGSEALLARHPTLEHFVFEAVRTNEVSRFMLGKNVKSLEEYKKGMEKFQFVGVSELLPLCHLVLSRMLKCPFTYPGRANVTDNPQVGTAVSQRLLDYLYTTQQMDVMFHDYMMHRFCALSGFLVPRSD
jgi:hypothetical protein